MIPPHESDSDFRVLHTLRCIGVSSEERVATASGGTRRDTGARLRNLSGQGLVALDPGPFGGWGLTDDGRTTEQELVRGEVELTGAHDHVRRWYEFFLDFNPKRIDESGQVICDELATRLSRFGVYGLRLSNALERALGGDPAYVTDSLESYHTVWFQLHEDLLVTLGISRDQERGGMSAAG